MGEELLRKHSATQVHLMSLECNKNPSRWIKDDERGAPDKCPVKYLVDLIMWTHSVSVCVYGVWGVCCATVMKWEKGGGAGGKPLNQLKLRQQNLRAPKFWLSFNCSFRLSVAYLLRMPYAIWHNSAEERRRRPTHTYVYSHIGDDGFALWSFFGKLIKQIK